MCGFTGYWLGDQPENSLEALLKRMAQRLTHRGPDDGGIWFDAARRIGLAHRRLSILDLSPAGHQPMLSASGRYVIAYNGEVYNFNELRKELEDTEDGPRNWRGHSDTEVMLACFERWGVLESIEKFIGMFAFALWDRDENTLWLTRDRLGIKPLYYGWQGKTFLFGSELKPLRQHPDFKGRVDRRVLPLFLRHNNIPAPWSIYEGIFKLPPGAALCLKNPQPGQLPEPQTYWSALDTTQNGITHPFTGTEKEALDELESRLDAAIAHRMIADVPLGAFLSGGVDSSTVVALMQKQSTRKVKTFTIGFNEAGYNEAEDALAVARHLGTEHTELYVTPEEARGVIPSLPEYYDEPFADSSQIPTFLVSQLARREVTVSLSGDGGDELFGGYNRYLWAENIWNKMKRVPGPLRSVTGEIIKTISAGMWDSVFSILRPVLPAALRFQHPGEKFHKLAYMLGADSPEAVYKSLISQWLSPMELTPGIAEPETPLTRAMQNSGGWDFRRRMMAWDTISYLPDDILTKVDRASMAVSLEARVPLLDHRVVEFAATLPHCMKFNPKGSKWLLRQVLYRHVPPKLIERPKAGFGVPIGDWLRGPLRDWGEALLDARKLKEEGFDPVPIRALWQRHLNETVNGQHPLWCVLMYQAWKEHLAS